MPKTPVHYGNWWFFPEDVVLIQSLYLGGAKVFLRGMGAWSFEIAADDAVRLLRAVRRRAAGLPADNDLDEQAYDRAKDEANDER